MDGLVNQPKVFRFWVARCDDELIKHFDAFPDILPSPDQVELAPHFKNDLTTNGQPGTVVFSSEPPHVAQWQHGNGWEWVRSPQSKDFWLLVRPGSLPFIDDMKREIIDGWPPDMTPLERNGWVFCNHIEQAGPCGPIFFDMSCGDNLYLPTPPRGLAWKHLGRQKFHLQPKGFVDQLREPFAYLYRRRSAVQ